MSKPSFQQRRGFTLLEVLLALVILSIVSVTVFTTFSNSFAMKERLDKIELETHRVRTFFDKVHRDISMLYMVKDKKYHTFIKGTDSGNSDELSFVTFSNRVYPESGVVSDQQIVRYYTEPNRDDPRNIDVFRMTYPFVEEERFWQDRLGVRILENVASFNLEYFDGNQPKEEWDTRSTETGGKIPTAIYVEVALNEDRVFQTEMSPRLSTTLGDKALKGKASQSKGKSDGKEKEKGKDKEGKDKSKGEKSPEGGNGENPTQLDGDSEGNF